MKEKKDKSVAAKPPAAAAAAADAIIKAMGDGLIVVDLDGNIVKVNEALTKILGYNKEELLGKPVLDSLKMKPESMEKSIPLLKQALEGASPSHVEMEGITKDGKEIFVSFGISTVKDTEGKPINLFAVLRDITELKRAEEMLRESKERFQALVESTSDWIWEVDVKGVYTYVTPKLKELLGYEPEEIIGKTPFDLMPPEEAKKIGEEFGAIVQSKQPFERLENWNLHKDGHLVLFETSGVPIIDKNDKLLGYRGIDRNITERKKMEEERVKAVAAAAAADGEKARIIDAIPDGIVVVDIEGKVVSVNSTILKVFGRKPEEIIGKDFESVQAWFGSPKDVEILLKAMGEALETGTTEKPVEVVITTKDGRRIPTDISYSIIKDAEGNPKNIVTSVRDITELKRMQEKEKEAAEKFTKELQEKLKELETFTKVAVGRELKMKKMEEEIEELKKKLEGKGRE